MKKKHNLAYKVSAVSIAVNLVLSLLKLAVGIVASSGAMISDAVHSASDVFSTIIVIVGIAMSRKKSDADHQYGHERMECMASLLLAAVLAFTGGGIGIKGIQKIAGGNYGNLAVPGALALAAAVVSILVKEWMYWYTRAAAKKINSGALLADAWHHRSDALSSVGALSVFSVREWDIRCWMRRQAWVSACLLRRRRLRSAGTLWIRWWINPARMNWWTGCGRS